MSNLLSRGARFHARHMPRAAGRVVTYRQGGLPYQLTAWQSFQQNDVLGTDGLLTQVVSFNWSFEASELPVAPRAGDTIEETIDGKTISYEVLPIAGRPCSEPLDTSGICLLVRTKKMQP